VRLNGDLLTQSLDQIRWRRHIFILFVGSGTAEAFLKQRRLGHLLLVLYDDAEKVLLVHKHIRNEKPRDREEPLYL
jgi:hypothetical protein